MGAHDLVKGYAAQASTRLVTEMTADSLMQIIQAIAACSVASHLQVSNQQRRGGGRLDSHAEYFGWGVGVGRAG